MFVLNSDITIGDFQFSGVHQVHISRSIYSLVETAKIQIPSVAKVVKNGKSDAQTVVTGSQFKVGDPVTIKLGYNNALFTEFEGFVQDLDLNMPLQVTCEGYSWLIKRVKVNISHQSASLTDLLELAVAGTNIQVNCDADISFSNIVVNGSGMDLINKIMHYTDGALQCFFRSTGELWCGFVYVPATEGVDVFGLGKVQYRLGYNVLKENELKVRSLTDSPTTVTYTKRISRGNTVEGTATGTGNVLETYSRTLNQIPSPSSLTELAEEKAIQLNYSGFEGHVNTFLQPFVAPGFLAKLNDARYPEFNETYLVESVDTRFGIHGARRSVEIGPKIGS